MYVEFNAQLILIQVTFNDENVIEWIYLVWLQQEVTDTGGARAAQISPPSDTI